MLVLCFVKPAQEHCARRQEIWAIAADHEGRGLLRPTVAGRKSGTYWPAVVMRITGPLGGSSCKYGPPAQAHHRRYAHADKEPLKA